MGDKHKKKSAKHAGSIEMDVLRKTHDGLQPSTKKLQPSAHKSSNIKKHHTYEFTDVETEDEFSQPTAGPSSRTVKTSVASRTENTSHMQQFQKKFAKLQKRLEDVPRAVTVTRESRKLIIENPLADSHSSDKSRKDRK